MSEAEGPTSTPEQGASPALSQKVCSACNFPKLLIYFSRNKSSPDGRQSKCKECAKNYLLQHEPKPDGRRKKYATNFEEQPETVRAIIACMMENPSMPWPEMAQRVGVSVTRIKNLVYSNAYIGALRTVANRKISSLIPKAVRALDESLESSNADVKFKSSVKLLENEKVLGPDRLDVTLNDLSRQPIDKLQEIIKQGASVPAPVIVDAEVIS